MVVWRRVGDFDPAPLAACVPENWKRSNEGFAMFKTFNIPDFPASLAFEVIAPLYPERHHSFGLLSKLIPGQRLKTHSDHHDDDCTVRIHVPILTNPDAVFSVDGEEFHMELGGVYEIDPTRQHYAANYGKTDRVHLIWNMVNG